MTEGEAKSDGEKTTEEAAKPDETKSDVIPALESKVLKNLVVLPPKQKDGTLNRDEVLDAVPLPPIRTEEPVSSIRAALSEVCGYAHLTNFRFVLEKPAASKASGKPNPSPPVISPYTGKDAVVSVPVAVRSLESEPQTTQEAEDATNPLVLDDYGDLLPLEKSGLTDGSAFRVVLERYDVASIRDHVNRLRSLLDGNAPSVFSLDEGADVKDKIAPSEAANATEKPTNASDSPPSMNEEAKKKATASEETNTVHNMPTFPDGKPLTPEIKNLENFFYYACGEDPTLYSENYKDIPGPNNNKENGKSKKKGKKGKGTPHGADDEKPEPSPEQFTRETIPRLNALEERTRVRCQIRLGGYHPPPPFRRLVGDLAYLEVTAPGESNVIHITAIPTGFYVNRSSTVDGFDPAPADKPCFSHELLDCLLQCSPSIEKAWIDALDASKERAGLMAKLNQEGPYDSLFRVAIRGDFSGYSRPSTASASEGIDALIQNPSWLVPIPKIMSETKDAWKRNQEHTHNFSKTEDDLANAFGVDIRSGTVRDWNEELQSSREMPLSTLQERIERARVMNKVLMDFGEASVLGVKAIYDGQIAPMNPNETTRSQVYLHNNIFFSRAVDAGIETFKIAKGDKAARKSASRDLQCLGSLHRMERPGLYTLATVLVDYLGTRYVCQSILPGILSGEKTHTLLYGAVEAGSPLVWDKEMHEILEDTLGKSLLIASRPLAREPLTGERVAEIEAAKLLSPLNDVQIGEEKKDDAEGEKKDSEMGPTVNICAPIEAKGIRGSDQRKYVLDMTRLTPRDANWVPSVKGGTGKWEALSSEGSSEDKDKIPNDLEDDEWTLAVLRPEIVTSYAQICMARYLGKKNGEKEKAESGEASKSDASEPEKPADKAQEATENTPTDNKNADAASNNGNKTEEEADKEEKEKKKTMLSEEDLDYLKSLRFNVNVFLPDVKSLEGIDDDAFAQIKKDEDMARDAAAYLWDEVLPRITREMRDNLTHQVPHDGKSLTEFVHQHGVNCRYFGRLAQLAQVEESREKKLMEEVKKGNQTKLDRRKMPSYWLEILECEMVARAAMHVLNRYLNENGGNALSAPAQTVASFLCALMSQTEETAAQSEKRQDKRNANDPDEDDYCGLTLYDAGGDGDAVPAPVRGRFEVWEDIEREIGRRFRYVLTLYNRPGANGRALYVPLLRRVCQRTGVRLAAKQYDIGGRCLCSAGGVGGQLTLSYPISPLDIIDIVPLMKHSAAHGEGFVPCGAGPSGGLPSLHISLQDARSALEAAHVQHSRKKLSEALDLAQEACGLYQRITETPGHPGVVRCIDLMANILLDAGEPALAAANAVKALGLQVQIGGFDSPDVIGSHLMICHMYLASGQLPKAVKHIRSATYLMEAMGGPHHVELSNAYHKMGQVYHRANDLVTALKFYNEASSRECADRLQEGLICKSAANVLASIGEFKLALENEKRAYQLFSALLGPDHQLTKASDQALSSFMKAALQFGSKMVEDRKKKEEEAAAEKIANEIAEEAAEEEKKKKKAAKKKKGKK